MGNLFLHGRSAKKDDNDPYAKLTVYCPSGITVRLNPVTGSTAFATISDDDGKAVFNRVPSGTWDIIFVDVEHATTERINISNLDYDITMTYFRATINVTYPEGSICTCTNGETTLTAPDTSGSCIFIIKKTGDWTVSCNRDELSCSTTTTISTDGDAKTVYLTYDKTPVLNADYPLNTIVISGTDAIFEAVIDTAGYPVDYTYQWYVNDIAVIGATDSRYTRLTSSDMGIYSVYCEVTNAAGTVRSRIANLTVNKTPVLDDNYPENVIIANIGDSITATVAISSDGYPKSYEYQWYVNDVPVTGATISSFVYTPTIGGGSTIYCEVKNIAGTVRSREALLLTAECTIIERGNQHTEIVGEWVVVNTDGGNVIWDHNKPDESGLTHPGASLICIDGGFVSMYNKNPINVTGYNSLDISAYGSSGDSEHRLIGLRTTPTSSTDIISHASGYSAYVTVGDGAVKPYIDISSLSGNYYIQIVSYDSTFSVGYLALLTENLGPSIQPM